MPSTLILTSTKPTFANPPILVLHGLEATGKSLTIRSILGSLDVPTAIASSKECITARHLLERTLAAVADTLIAGGKETAIDVDGRCDSISVFVAQMQRILEGKGKFIVVFDGIDSQREAFPTLIPAIARLGEIVRSTMYSIPLKLRLFRYKISPSSWSSQHLVLLSNWKECPTSTSPHIPELRVFPLSPVLLFHYSRLPVANPCRAHAITLQAATMMIPLGYGHVFVQRFGIPSGKAWHGTF